MGSHELNSVMLYIHPPLAIAGEIFVFLFAFMLLKSQFREKRVTLYVGLTTWLLVLSGLVSGMIWAQMAWGGYWSWDPKETTDLLLFLAVSFTFAAQYEKKLSFAEWASLISCLMAIITVLTSFIIPGLHSFA